MRSATISLVAALLMASAITTAQPPTAFVSGTVFDPSGGVIANAKVVLVQRNRESLQANTDLRGEFRFDAVAPGRHELRLEYPGFATQQIRLNVETRALSPLRIVLAIAELQETLKVECPEGRVSTEVSDNVDAIPLTPPELVNLPIMDGDAIGALSRLLGPAAVGHGGPPVVVGGSAASEAIS